MMEHGRQDAEVADKGERNACLVLLAAAMLFLVIAGCLNVVCYRDRTGRMRKVDNLDHAPPPVVFTSVVLGGFRGILSDILWLRASYLQDSGEYVELVQLADWVTRLEPESPETWSFHSWNMAYNVSVYMPDDETRWRWVQSGIRLLRDEGLRFTPSEPDLYAQLAWLYNHKIAGFTDTANGHYKQRVAAEMEGLFPGGRPPFHDPAAMERARQAAKLDPVRVREAEHKFGQMDWRAPETHAAYWAYLGTLASRGRGTMLCRRILYQALASSFFRGALAPDPGGLCDVRLTRRAMEVPALEAFLNVMHEVPQAGMDESVSNFVHDAILVHNAFGDEARASELLGLLRERYPAGNLDASVPEYCAREPGFAAMHAHGAEPLALVEGYLDRHWRAVARRDAVAADAAWGVAVNVWATFEKKTNPAVRKRFNVPPFDRFARAVFDRAIASISPEARGLLERDWAARMGEKGPR
jgi:hypothetical protein